MDKFSYKRRNAIELNPIIDEKKLDYLFPIVRASELSINDEIFRFTSESISQMLLKIHVMNALLYDIPDFRAQRFELQINEKGKIIYNPEGISAFKTPNCWMREANKLLSYKNSRLGTDIERYAFYGVVIKELVEKHNYGVSQAWEEMSALNYKQEENKLLQMLKLDNTPKLTLDHRDPNKFWVFESNGNSTSLECPTVVVDMEEENEKTIHGINFTGWIVMDV